MCATHDFSGNISNAYSLTNHRLGAIGFKACARQGDVNDAALQCAAILARNQSRAFSSKALRAAFLDKAKTVFIDQPDKLISQPVTLDLADFESDCNCLLYTSDAADE